MIGYLTGSPEVVGSDLLIHVGGVGYQVSVSPSLLSACAHQPETSLYVYTHVREDALELYGFRTAEEKRLFLLLLDVSGVGPRTALAISDWGSEAIVTAVQQADTKFFAGIPRVGKKMAQKIIIELKSKLGSLKELQLGPTNSQEQEIVVALAGLGFAEEDVLTIMREEDFSQVPLEESIKRIIQKIGKV